MIHYLLLSLSVCVNVAGSSVNNRFSKKQLTSPVLVSIYNLIVALAALLVIILTGKIGSCSPTTLLLGLIFGILNGLSIVARTSALSCGPMSLTLLVGSCGMLIPTFSGAVFWKEPLGLSQIIGVILMIAALSLVMDVRAGKEHISPKWIVFSSLCFLCTGFISIMQKVQQNSSVAHESGAFLMVAFLVSVLMNVVLLSVSLIKQKKAASDSDAPKGRFSPALLFGGAATGCCTGMNHTLNLFLSGVIPAVVFFPLVNGGGILLSGLVGLVLFREKCSVRQLIGFGVGVAAILFIGGLFG